MEQFNLKIANLKKYKMYIINEIIFCFCYIYIEMHKRLERLINTFLNYKQSCTKHITLHDTKTVTGKVVLPGGTQQMVAVTAT